MKKIKRSRFFVSLGTGILSLSILRNFSFEAFGSRVAKGNSVKVKPNPLSVSRNKSGGSNAG